MYCIECGKKLLCQFYFEIFEFWAVGLRPPTPCPTMPFAYFLYNIHILILSKYFGWALTFTGGTYLYRTFPVFYMFDSTNKTLETKFRSILILTENMNHNLINIDLWLEV